MSCSAGPAKLKLELQAGGIEKQTGKKPFFAGHRYEMTAQTWKAVMRKNLYAFYLTKSQVVHRVR